MAGTTGALSDLADAAGGTGAAATERGGIAVGVPTGMEHQGASDEIVSHQSRCHHSGDGAAVVFHHKPAEIATVTLAKGTLVGSCLIRIPVATSLQSSDADPFSVLIRQATAVAVQMEAVFPYRKALKRRLDHQALVGIGCGDRADARADAFCIDAMELHFNRTCPGGRCSQQAQTQNNCEQKTFHITEMTQTSLTFTSPDP